jgi:hypothetical protein
MATMPDAAPTPGAGRTYRPGDCRRRKDLSGMQTGALRKAAGRERVPLVAPERRNQRWSMDSVSDSLCSGRWFWILNIVAEDLRSTPFHSARQFAQPLTGLTSATPRRMTRLKTWREVRDRNRSTICYRLDHQRGVHAVASCAGDQDYFFSP